MKLLFLTEFFPQNNDLIFTGGVEARVYYIATLAKKDFKVKVISSSSKKIPATFLSVFTRIYYLISAFIKALFTDFDVVEASNFVSYLPAFFAAKIKGKKAIAWIPDLLGKDWFQFGCFVGISGYILEKISLILPWDHVIALSNSTKSKLLKTGLDPNKISVVHGGIEPKEFNLKKSTKFSKFTIICIARLVNTKRVKDLIKALKKVKKANLIIIGFGPLELQLQKLTQKLKLENRISFEKNLPRHHLIETINRSHLFCLPSTVEGFGLVTIESMALGLPAVLADIPINQEITQQGQGAVFFKPKDSDDLAKKINLLIKNKKLYRDKAKKAKLLAKTCSWQRLYQKTKKIYENCYSG